MSTTDSTVDLEVKSSRAHPSDDDMFSTRMTTTIWTNIVGEDRFDYVAKKYIGHRR